MDSDQAQVVERVVSGPDDVKWCSNRADSLLVRWVSFLATAVVTLVVFWLPGWVVIRAWSTQRGRLAAAAAAPVVTLGLFATVAVLTDGWWRWGPVLATIATVATAGVGLAVRRFRPHASCRRPVVRESTSRALVLAIVAGVLAQIAPFAIGMRRPDGWLTAQDTTVHLAEIDYIRTTGHGSSMHMATGTLLHGIGGFDGAAWHDTAALVPRWPDPAVVSNAALLIPVTVAWTLGLAYLTQVAFPARPRAWVWAPILGSAGGVLPIYLALRIAGQTPNAVALALLPALVAFVVEGVRDRERSAIVPIALSVMGIALCHPNSLFTAAVVLGPWIVVEIRRAIWRAARPAVAVAVLALVVWVGGAGAAVVVGSPRFLGVVDYHPNPPLNPWEALTRLLSGNVTNDALATGFVVMVAAVVGMIVGRRLPGCRWAAWGLIAIAALYLASTSTVPVLNDVDRLWYGDPARFGPAITAMAVPFAALGLDSATRALRRRLAEIGRPKRLAIVLVVALVGVPAAVGLVGYGALVRWTFVPSASSIALADDAELAMADRLPHELDRNRAVLGSPFTGTANLLDRFGQRVIPRTWGDMGDPYLEYVMRHLDELGHNPALCRSLDTLGVHYLYVDPDEWTSGWDTIELRRAPVDGVRLLDRGGSAAVYEITAC